MDLYKGSKITAEEAEVLMQANRIILRANAKVRRWTEKAIQLRLIFENSVVKAHINGGRK